MTFNTYLWGLYRQSPAGRKAIEEFEQADGYTLVQKYCPMLACHVQKEEYDYWLEDFYCYSVSEFDVPNSLEEAKDLYEALVSFGLFIEGEQIIKHGDFKLMLDYVTHISYLLYKSFPNYFFPYLFLYRFFDFTRITDLFGIDLSPVPQRADCKGRCMYYWQLCELFYQFRKENDLSMSELCAFLYDFAPNLIDKTETHIPQPAQAWFIGGKIADEEKQGSMTFWQPNNEIRERRRVSCGTGDIRPR